MLEIIAIAMSMSIIVTTLQLVVYCAISLFQLKAKEFEISFCT